MQINRITKLLNLRLFANFTLATVFVGAFVTIFGFGTIIYLAKAQVEKETDQKVTQAVQLIQNYVDGQLQRVEDVGYTLLSSWFAVKDRNEDGSANVSIDPKRVVIPSEEEVFSMLEQFINANPLICGVAMGFEPFLYTGTKGEYGFAAYVTNVSGHNERLRLGEIHNYRQKEWYMGAAAQNSSYWSRPFEETSMHQVVACYSIPLHDNDGRIIGVLALDINTDKFRSKCNEVTPISGSEVALVDREFNVISHPNQSYILKNIRDIDQYADYHSTDSLREKMLNSQSGQHLINEGSSREAMFYYAPIKRAGWTISVECPVSEIYKGLDHLKYITRLIGFLSILFMLLCFGLLFVRIRNVMASKAGIERDLEIASNVQMGMLPKLYPAFPERNDIDVYGFLKPAKTVGGDIYDYFIRDGKLFFCIGDVSGKGIPSSLFMVVVKTLFRNVSLHSSDPADIISAINTTLSDGNIHNMFCTMFLGVLDMSTGHLEYCNAGHNPPIVRRLLGDGKVDVHYTKPKVNIAVGVFDGFEYEKEETVLSPGEAIFMYTDGVTEAENKNKLLFGDEGALKALADARLHNARSAKEFVDSVYEHIKGHAGYAEQSDDITMLVVEYKGTGTQDDDTSLHLKNDINDIPKLGEWVERIGRRYDISHDTIFSLNLALEEAVANVMNYAYPGQKDMPIDIKYSINGSELTFTIDDMGIAFDPTKKEDPDITLDADKRPIGGLGIMLVRHTIDKIDYQRIDNHNMLILKKII